jgi:hypothetical protein
VIGPYCAVEFCWHQAGIAQQLCVSAKSARMRVVGKKENGEKRLLNGDFLSHGSFFDI